MIRARLDWNDKAGPQVIAAAWENLVRAVVTYHTLLLTTLNVANPRPYKTSSKPDEPPRKRSGWLQSHTLYELDEGTHSARVGVATNAIYGVFLELGTRLMKARPWLLATLKKHWDRIAAIAGGR